MRYNIRMSYYIKKTNLKKGLYLQIYEGHHDPLKGRTVSTLYRKLGYLDDLRDGGIEDPIAHFQKEVDALNAELRMKRAEERKDRLTIENGSGILHFGHFALREIMEELDARRYFDLLQAARTDCRFSTYELFCSLVYARIICPRSKLATYERVIPSLMGCEASGYDDILSCCEFLGQHYEDYVDLFRSCVARRYGIDASTAFFDCTNFYFEIDREDGFRMKGKSKENRHDPIVNLGLLLDGSMLPIGMRIYSGEQSEQPVLRQVLGEMKRKSGITGKTVQVADKGLNSANNILKARIGGDGYIFSKSVKRLPETELAWVFKDDAWIDVMDEDEPGRIAYRYRTCEDEFLYSPTDPDLVEELKAMGLYGRHNEGGRTVWGTKVREKRVLTYNPDLAKKQLAEIDRMVEKARNLVYSRAKRDEFGECGRFVEFVSKSEPEKRNAVAARMDMEAVDDARRFAGLNMIVTSECGMDARRIYAIYHRLWKIEESFRLMKSGIESRPVYLQLENRIKGHFLVCYAAALLLRILELKKLGDRWSYQQILEQLRDLRIVKPDERTFLNVSTRKTELMQELSALYGVPLDSLFLSKKDIGRMGLLG